MGIISRFALRNPIVIALVLVLVVGGGVYSAISLHQEALPDITFPSVTVTTTYSGAPAAVVLDNVTKPLEAALAGVSGIQSLDSTSAEGISLVLARFDVGSDTRALQRVVQDAVNGVALPSGTSRPEVDLGGLNSRPIMIYSLAGADVASLTNLAQNVVMPAAQNVDGVAGVTVVGGATRDVLVNADPAMLKRYGVSMTALDNAIKAGTVSQPVGVVTLGGVNQPVSAGSTPANLAAIRALPVASSAPSLVSVAGGATSSTGSSGTVTPTSAISRSIEQADGYLNAAWNELLVLSGPPPPNASIPVGNGWTQGAQSDIVDALTVINTQPDVAANDVRLAVNWLLKRTLKHQPDYAKNPHFTNALSWLQLAGTALALGGTGTPKLTVGDLATVTLGTPGIGALVHSNGRTGVLVQIMRSDTADTTHVAGLVRQALTGLRLPSDVSLTKVSDASDTIAASIGGAVREGLLGALLAVLIIGLFLRNWYATIIAAMNIPVSFLLTMTVLNGLGLTLNIITLAGVAVATGRVVDDSIVVIENLYRRIARGEAVTRATVLAGVTDVGAAIASSTATTICVFLPLAFVTGIVTVAFAPFAWTVTIHLIASYLAAITVVPLLAYWLFRRGHVPREADDDALTRAYRAALVWSLDHRRMALLATALTVLVALVILRGMPSNLIPQPGPAAATVSLTAPTGSTVQATGMAASRVERVIGVDGDVASYYTTIGAVSRSGLLGGNNRVLAQGNQGTISVTFKDGVDGDTATAHLRALLSGGQYGATLNVHKAGDASSALELDVTGSNPDNIRAVTPQVVDAVRAVGSVDALTDTLAASQPELQIQIDPARAALYGLTPAGVAAQLQALINGATVAHVSLNGAATDVFAAAAPSTVAASSDLAALPIDAGSARITLGQVATLRPVTNLASITRHNQQLASRVTGVIVGSDVGGISQRIQRKVGAIALPGDTMIVLAGVSQQQRTAFSNVYTSMLVAVVLVFIVMVLAFRTLAAPFAILFSLPVTLIGAAGGLVLGRQALGLPALIGFLMLIGIVVTNAIVLMTRVQQYREAGAATRTALLDAGVNRLRPILMTALATIGALIPLALGLAEGSLISQSLADTVIGGLVSSTVLTLVVVPVVFSLLVPDSTASPVHAPPTKAPIGVS